MSSAWFATYASTHRHDHDRDSPGHEDVSFCFDPVRPFVWITSKWVRQVAAERDYTPTGGFISLQIINAGVGNDSHFPAGYEDGHAAGLQLLQVAAPGQRRADSGNTPGTTEDSRTHRTAPRDGLQAAVAREVGFGVVGRGGGWLVEVAGADQSKPGERADHGEDAGDREDLADAGHEGPVRRCVTKSQ
jgi:hypothetical protein